MKFDGWPLKTNRALLLYYVKLCASFQIHWWIQNGVTVQKRSIRVEICEILSCMTLKFDGWPWKTTGHLFYTTSSLCIISKPSVKSNLSCTPEMLNSGKNQQFFVPCDLEIWWMTLKNNMAPLLYCFKLCASFHSHWWIQTEVTVRKRSIWVKIDDFFIRVTMKFDEWPWKTISHIFYTTLSFVHPFKAMN